MRILMINTGSYSFPDTKESIINIGYKVDEMTYSFVDIFRDDIFSEKINHTLKILKYDRIFSIGFFPLIAKTAHEFGIPYVSWSLESPLSESCSDYFVFDTNHIFLFDRSEVEKYNKAGFCNVFHLPAAINTDRISKLSFANEINQKYSSDVSFVGSLFESTLDALMFYADDYVKGYVEGLFQSQFKIYGCNFIEKAIPDSILESLEKSLKNIGKSDLKISKIMLANSLYNQITNAERTVLMESLAETYDVRFYSERKHDLSMKIKQPGPFKEECERFTVYKNSKLNLFVSNKNIESGIPLEALEILASNSVLFSNYQPELSEYFTDGEDIIMYESIEDALIKADYYLNKKTLLSSIASAGFEKIKKYFSYEERIPQLFSF